MRKQIISFLILSLMLVDCQDSTLNKEENSTSKFSKDIGKQIPYDLALSWMSNYKKYDGARLSSTSSFKITAHLFKAMAKDSLVGVSFHYATDEEGINHIIAVPMIEGTSSDRDDLVLIDANTSNTIDVDIAQTWFRNYEESHPSSVWYHFFGHNVIKEINTLDFNHINIEPAINDEGEPQLILLVYLKNSASGRVMYTKPVAYDMSSPCPPCAKAEQLKDLE